MEWNSKDQTFDRDLLAMRTYFDCGLIDVGVIVTRAEELNDIFKQEKDDNGQPLMKKYGASTTWMGKLKYRLDSRRNGGCPILAIGIGKECVEGYGRLTNYYRKFTTIYGGEKYNTIYADPPWQFQNRTGKVAPEHKRLTRYETMTLNDIKELPIADIAGDKAQLYLWVPNALLPDGLAVMDAWGFDYKANIVWEKVRKDGGPDGRGVGFYFRNVTELLLFGIKKKVHLTEHCNQLVHRLI